MRNSILIMSNEEIPLRLLKGFRDFLPHDEYKREHAISMLQKSFRQHGYQPIDTPVLEYTDILLRRSGGETEKQVFRFKDAGGRDVTMRFDLTVPLARFLVMHQHALSMPFRSYHIAKVWRGENPQKGRYREFYQCDFDIIGTESLQADLEILLLTYDSLKTLGFDKFKIHISHRKLIEALLDFWDLTHCLEDVLLHLDKFSKTDYKESYKNFEKLIPDHIEWFWSIIVPDPDWKKQLLKLADLCKFSDSMNMIISYFKNLYEYLEELGISERFVFDVSIVRGLDYYTGLVFETFLEEYLDIGSICSGGRYDHLTKSYNDDWMPGVGGSIGLDRLLEANKEDLRLGFNKKFGQIDVMMMYSQDMKAQQKLCRLLQSHGFTAICFPDDKKIKSQFRYAVDRGVSCVVFYDEQESQYKLRDLQRHQDHIFENMVEILSLLKRIL